MKMDYSNKREYSVFEVENSDFVVEITEEAFSNENYVECWLYRKGYGIKELMFGIKNNYEVHDIIQRNLEEYIELYEEKYCDE